MDIASLMHCSLFFSFSVIFILSFFLLKRSYFTPASKKNSLPSPSKLPIFGNLHNIGRDAHRSLHSLAQVHGPLMLLHFGRVPVLVVSSADAARYIMKTHDLNFANRPQSRMFEKLLCNYKDLSTAPYGEYWRKMRTISVLQLLSSKRVQSCCNVREEETEIMMAKIKQASCSFLPVNLSGLFLILTNDVVCRVALGKKYRESEEVGRKFKEILEEFFELLGTLRVGDYIPWLSWLSRVNGLDSRVDKVAKELDDFLDQVVEEHLDCLKKRSRSTDHNHKNNISSQEGQNDFVDVLISIQMDNTGETSIDRVSIKALLLDMFAAGTHTASTALDWAMTELLTHPIIMKELQKEVRSSACARTHILEADLEKLNYLKAVIKETLRLHPPLPLLFPRISTEDVNIKGYDIAAGTQVIVNAWAIGRDQVSWESPHEFKPERFLNNSIDFKGHDFQLIPFGAGRRGCPGIQFTTAVIELALAKLVCRFDWTLPGGAENLDMTESTGLTIRRKFPLVAVAKQPE